MSATDRIADAGDSKTRSANSRAALFFIALGLFGLYAVEFGVVGLLPSIVQRYHVSVAQAGWLVSLFAGVVAVCGPVMVLWLSRFDPRKVLVGALLVFALCSLLSAYAPSFALLAALRLPSALLHPVFFATAFAAAVALYPPERATHAMTMAFVGTTLGLVLGVPLTTWIDTRLSYALAFGFCAVVTMLAALGLWWTLPSRRHRRSAHSTAPLAILGRPAVLWSIVMTVGVFAAMFSVYSYAAEYLMREFDLSGETVSLLLAVFGVGGVGGNLLAGRALAWRPAATVCAYPIALAATYLALALVDSSSWLATLPLCLLWGAAHTSGLIVSQVWISSAAPEAPEFATSLYISAANLGVVAGAFGAGLCIDWIGLRGALFSGWLFNALALAAILARNRLR